MARDRDRTAAKPERKNCQLGGPVASKWDLTHGSGSTSVNGVDSHPPHANTRQVQTNRHNIRHRGLLGPANLVTHRFQRGLTPTVIATSPGFWDVSPGFWGSSPKFTDFANLNGIGQQLEVVIGSLEATTLHNVHYGTCMEPGYGLGSGEVSDLTLVGEFSRTWREFSSSWRMSHWLGEWVRALSVIGCLTVDIRCWSPARRRRSAGRFVRTVRPPPMLWTWRVRPGPP